MEENIIGFDTIKLYYRENLHQHIKHFIQLNRRKNEYWYTFRKAEIIFSFSHGMTTIRFSAAKVYYKGDNTILVGLRETQIVLQLISELIMFDLKQFRISRLHITSNFSTEFGIRRFFNHLECPSYFQGKTPKRYGFYYHTNGEKEKSKRLILFYKKAHLNLLRVEVKFESVWCSGGSMNRLFKYFLKHDNTAINLYKESFYIACINYYIRMVGKTLGKRHIKRDDKITKDELFYGLQKSFSHSLYHLNTQW